MSIQEPPARPRWASLIRPGPRFRYPWSDPPPGPVWLISRPRGGFSSSLVAWWSVDVSVALCRVCSAWLSLSCVCGCGWVCLGPLPLSLPHTVRGGCVSVCVLWCHFAVRALDFSRLAIETRSGTVCSLQFAVCKSFISHTHGNLFAHSPGLDLIHPEDHHRPMPGARRRIVCPVKHLPRST